MRCRVGRTVGALAVLVAILLPGTASSQTRLGLAVGATAASIVTPLTLGASSCTGSGEYLRTCRLIFVGSVAASAGLGALAGRMIETDSPRASSTLSGAALGALGAFALSLPLCDQEDEDNPAALCGYDGMLEPGTAAVGAVIGGIVGYLLPQGEGRLEVSHLGPVAVPGEGNTWGLALTLPTR